MPKTSRLRQRRLRLGERARPRGDTDRLVGIQALDEPPAQLGTKSNNTS